MFIFVFVLGRKYRAAVLTLASAVGLTVPCLFLLTPSFAYSLHGFLNGLVYFNKVVVSVIIPHAIGYDHSFFTLVKYAHYALVGSLRGIDWTLHIYTALMCSAFALLLWKSVRFLPLINQVLAFTITSAVMSPASFDYTLMHLYIPFAMLALCAVRKSERIAGQVPVFVCFALLTSPQSFLILHGRTFSGQFKAVVAIVLLFLCVKFPFWSEFDDSSPEGERYNLTYSHGIGLGSDGAK